MPNKPKRFEARILKQGSNCYVEVPDAVSVSFTKYTERGRVRVYGRLNAAEIRGNLVPRKTGHWLFLHAGMRAAAGVSVGDRVTLELRATRWHDVPIAKDVKRALKKAALLDVFEAKSSSHRHELMRWVDVAESPEDRAKRLASSIEQLRGSLPPVKPGQASRRDKPLWTCPKCGHVFVNVNQWHSCKRYTVDQSFAKSGPEMRALFEQVRATVAAVGPASVQAYRDKVAFVVRVRFLSVTPKTRWLDLGFWFPRRVDSNRFRKVETLTPTDHIHMLRITSAGDLDDQVVEWIREGYAVGEQKHLR